MLVPERSFQPSPQVSLNFSPALGTVWNSQSFLPVRASKARGIAGGPLRDLVDVGADDHDVAVDGRRAVVRHADLHDAAGAESGGGRARRGVDAISRLPARNTIRGASPPAPGQ